jgi:hypothetical protein
MRGLVLAIALVGAAHADEEWAEDAEKEMAKAAEYLGQNDLHAARDHFEAARKLAPERPGPYYWLGLVHARLGQCERAVPYFDEYILRKEGEPKPDALRMLKDCKAQLRTRPTGALSVTSEPPGAEVRLDEGPPAGSTPLSLPKVPVGAHRVSLLRAGYERAAMEVQVRAGAEATVVVALRPLKRR